MSTPLEIRASFTLTANTTVKNCNLSNALPSTNYLVAADFPYSCGNWWITNKTASSFQIHVTTSNASDQAFTIYIYWDDKDSKCGTECSCNVDCTCNTQGCNVNCPCNTQGCNMNCTCDTDRCGSNCTCDVFCTCDSDCSNCEPNNCPECCDTDGCGTNCTCNTDGCGTNCTCNTDGCGVNCYCNADV